MRRNLSSLSVPMALLVWLAAAYALLAWDLSDGVRFYGPFDDRMRALQIRDLLSDGAWFDLVQPFLATAEPYVSPWSRLVDAPYAGVTLLLQGFMGQDEAFHWATLVIPPLLLAIAGFLLVDTARLLAGRRLDATECVAMVLVAGLALFEFTPGQIDHHNVQILFVALVARGIADPAGGRGGLLAGLGTTLSLTVGLETMPFVVLLLAVPVLAWAMCRLEARRFVPSLGITLLVTAPASALAFKGWGGMVETACDSWSAPFVTALAGGGALLVAMQAIVARLPALDAPLPRSAMLAVAGAGFAALLAVTFPACLNGPFGMIDDVSRWFWFDRVPQEKSFLFLFRDGKAIEVMLLLLAFLIALAVLPGAVHRARNGDPATLAIAVTVLAAFAMTLLQTRNSRFPPVLAALLVPLLADLLTRPAALPLAWKRMLGVLAALAFGGVAVGSVLLPDFNRPKHVYDLTIDDRCDEDAMATVRALPPSRFLAAMGVGLRIAETGMGHQVAALPFHRASSGIRRVALALTSEDPSVRAAQLEGFDYVAICRRSQLPLQGEAFLFDALNAGRSVPGLVPVNNAADGEVAIFRIDHSALR